MNDPADMPESGLKIKRQPAIVRLFLLRPPEQRRVGIVPLILLGVNRDLRRDSQYLFYILLKLTLLINISVFAFMLADVYSGVGLVFNPEAFYRNKLLIPVAFSKTVRWPDFLLTIPFYIRTRLATNLRVERDLIQVKKSQAHWSRSHWIYVGTLGLVVAILTLFESHLSVIEFFRFFHQTDSLFCILTLQAILVIGLAMMPPFLIQCILLLEKVVRFFPELQQELCEDDPETPTRINL